MRLLHFLLGRRSSGGNFPWSIKLSWRWREMAVSTGANRSEKIPLCRWRGTSQEVPKTFWGWKKPFQKTQTFFPVQLQKTDQAVCLKNCCRTASYLSNNKWVGRNVLDLSPFLHLSEFWHEKEMWSLSIINFSWSELKALEIFKGLQRNTVRGMMLCIYTKVFYFSDFLKWKPLKCNRM